MEPNGLVIAGAVAALMFNSLAVVAIGWRGGRILGNLETTMGTLSGEVRELRATRDTHTRILGNMETTMETISEEVHGLRATRDDHTGILARVVGQLDGLEQRVGYLEGPVRRTPRS